MIAYTNSSGASTWRIIDPWAELQKQYPQFETHIAKNGIQESDVAQADVVMLQSIVDKEALAMIRAYQAEKGLKVICDVDDWHFDLNSDNPFAVDHKASNASFVIKKTLEFADMITVTTDYLANKVSTINKNVYVFPNYMNRKRWLNEKQTLRKPRKHCKIGWLGSITHYDDFKVCANQLRYILQNFDCELVTQGDVRIKDYFEGLDNVECTIGVPSEYCVDKATGMDIDVGIAPLRDTEFNRNKSGIKAMEYAIQYAPTIASNIVNFKDVMNEDMGISVNDYGWHDALKFVVENPEWRVETGRTARARVVNNFMLDDNIFKLKDIYDHL